MLKLQDLLICYSYGIPLFAINLRTIYVLFRNQNGKFSSTYYRIFMLCGLNECILYALNNYCVRLPSVPFLYAIYFSYFNTFTHSKSFIYFMRRYCSYFIHFGNSLLVLNRLTAVWKYVEYEQMWRENQFYLLFFAYMGTFLMSFQELFNSTMFAVSTVGDIKVVQLICDNYLNLVDTTKASAPTIGLSIIFGILCTTVTLIFWKRKKLQIPSKNQKFELRLVWLTVVVYTVSILGFIYHLVRFIIFNPVQQYFFYMIISDFFALIPTCAFLVAAPTLRAAVFPFIPKNIIGVDQSSSIFHTRLI